MIDTLKYVFIQLIGSYETNPDIPGVAGLDFPWIFSAILAIVLVWACFTFIRELIRRWF